MTDLRTRTVGAELDHVARVLRGVTVVVRSARGERGEGEGQGAGIVWSADGSIVTNAHVATGATARVALADGRAAEARVVARDVKRDLALLRVNIDRFGGALPVPTLGEPSALRVGDVVLALGHPFGLEHALSLGVVHAAPDSGRSHYLLADIRLAPGNSGGPLADARGRIVGVNSMIVGGLGVAVSVDAVHRLVSAAAARHAA